MAQEPPDPEDTGGFPVGPEPDATGRSAGGGGPGGWGPEPRTEPFAVAAVVWAVVSIVIPLVGTIVALVLAGVAADSIRRSSGARRGQDLVLAARVVAGVVITLWAIGLVLFLALRSGDTNDRKVVAIPTQPPISSAAPSSSDKRPGTTAPVKTIPPVTTRPITPTTAILPPPTVAPTVPPTPAPTVPPPPPTAAPTVVPTAPPTAPPTAAPTLAPTIAPTAPPTVAPTAPPTVAPTKPPPTVPPATTSPAQKQAGILAERMLASPVLGRSNRGVPDARQYVVTYKPGDPLVVTWAINNGSPPLPTGAATCTPTPTTTAPSGTTTTVSSLPTASTSTTTTMVPSVTTTLPPTVPTAQPPERSTPDRARVDAEQILKIVRQRRSSLDIPSIVLVGTYPMDGTTDTEVVRVTYARALLNAPITFPAARAFEVPPAKSLECINPAFEE